MSESYLQKQAKTDYKATNRGGLERTYESYVELERSFPKSMGIENVIHVSLWPKIRVAAAHRFELICHIALL